MTFAALIALLTAMEGLAKSVLDGLPADVKQQLWDRHVKRTAWIEAILEQGSADIAAAIKKGQQ